MTRKRHNPPGRVQRRREARQSGGPAGFQIQIAHNRRTGEYAVRIELESEDDTVIVSLHPADVRELAEALNGAVDFIEQDQRARGEDGSN